jgi:PRTRC genetic system protein C
MSIPTNTRIFKTGSTLITETPEMRDQSIEQVRQLLKTTYPEIAHATVRERTEGDTLVVEFLPVAGRKG